MFILFPYQDFPGQFLHAPSALQSANAHELLALTQVDDWRRSSAQHCEK
jgi:hypothetical protein